MKAHFTSPLMTSAYLVRGYWRWRRVAYVHETEAKFRYGADLEIGFRGHEASHWAFDAHGELVGERISIRIHEARERLPSARKAQVRKRAWVRVSDLPEARLLR